MINILFFLVFSTIIVYIIAIIAKADIIVSPILGSMVGFLYSETEYEDAVERTIQICIFIISVTIIWETPIG